MVCPCGSKSRMEKVLYSDIGRAMIEIMDCQCPDSSLSKEEMLKEYDSSISDCYGMLQHYLDMQKTSIRGTKRYEMAKEEVAYWSRMLKTAKIQRRGLVTA